MNRIAMKTGITLGMVLAMSATWTAAQAPAPLLAQADRLSPSLGTRAPRARVELADRIVAVVNDEAITLRELNERVKLARGQLQRQRVTPPPDDVLEKQVLERMIVDRAQLQFARENAIRIDDVALDRTVARIAEDNRMSLSQFRDVLERDGIAFAKFREDVRNDILIARVREREVDSRIAISDGEVDNFLAQADGARSDASMEVNLAQILVRVPENATPEQLAERGRRAEAALAQVRGGADFGQVSAAVSDAPEALSGGVLGHRSMDRLPQLFVDAVLNLPVGAVSEIVKSPNGFHILKVLDRRGGTAAAPVTQTRVRHILVRPNELVSQDQAERRLRELRERLVNKAAEFADLARLHSNDGSASRGGDLGWVYPGDTVPEFEKAMNELKPGEISVPVRTQFGWHLIEVLERRIEDVSQERKRQAARQALRERKVDEAYQEWLRQLRDRAFVEIRLDER
ncbi:MAG: peptidylprolyl isomerase [Burkholderiales bacterium]|nr:peptidylprolyl isomerase [Burkholderiales bacterium]